MRPLSRTGFLGGAEGATSVEYAILVSLIAAMVVAAVVALGAQLPSLFRSVLEGWS